MEIKDYCDIHGEPICVGDFVEIRWHGDCETKNIYGYFESVCSNGNVVIRSSMNGDCERETIRMNSDDTIEILQKYKKEESKPDMVNHPPHYQSENGIEVIDVIEAFTADLKGGEATNTGNVIKYILRWPHKKNPLEDLKKARWYLDRLIKIVEAKMEKENA